jgi:ABC-type bacteriocin/lantibiotic exporter with double-glycine peptidase domain
LTEVGDQIAAFFYGPLQILFGLFMMYYILGLTFLTTIGVILVILAVSYFLSKITVKLNERVLKAKD